MFEPSVLRAARGYAKAGWPVAPEGPDWHRLATTDPARVDALWAEPTQRSGIVLPTGVRFDVLAASTALGAQAMRMLERQPGPYPAVARTGAGRWLFFTKPLPEGREAPALDGFGWVEDVAHHGRGDCVLAPPSARPGGGRDRWVWPWRSRTDHLPALDAVLTALFAAQAAMPEQCGEWGPRGSAG